MLRFSIVNKVVVLLSMLFCWPILVAAEATDTAKPLWEVGLGSAYFSLPHYRGSAQQSSYLLPFPYLIYRGETIKADGRSVRGILLDRERFHADLSFDLTPQTRSSDDPLRQGMPDRDPLLEIGPSLQVDLQKGGVAEGEMVWQAVVALRHAITVPDVASHGWLLYPHLKGDYRTNEGLRLSGMVGPLFATQEYHSYYYDVEAAQARVGRAEYHADGGFSGNRLTMTASKKVGSWWLGAFVRYDDLHGAVMEDSPLLAQKQNVSVGIGAAWVFATSNETVSTRE
ncbi:MipA/OmpV family protein [Candidatus Magnetaquicoccus inordinatus]|uniref:MipA/OmpV family protein n=1 Tax=Candidatus Magnetaquicoccus inordinatus TaxID=2496818 RepID=UPI00102D039E|nr:MipA/OmpV family protein [Candidatus Magnetaquicoccus inordinatus]